MTLLLAFLLFAQTMGPQQAYTTNDPVSPDRIGLAMLGGRYLIDLGADCDGLVVGVNVMVSELNGAVRINDACEVVAYQRMSDVPCFQTDGVCDVAAETD